MPAAARGEVVELEPAEIRQKRFEFVKRGYDPPSVERFLDQIAGEIERRDRELSEVSATMERFEREIAEARGSEEALRLTLVAATQAKEEMLRAARNEADELVASATERAKELLLGSEREANSTVAAAKKQAEDLLTSSQTETDAMARSALEANAVLLERLEALSGIVGETEGLLRSIAEDAVPQLEHARGTLLEAITESKESPEKTTERRVTDGALAAMPVEATGAEPVEVEEDGDFVGKVDRLLEELREVNP